LKKNPEIVVASGKGGTGKTTISSFLITFLWKKGLSVVGVDADVEAPDLVIALGDHREVSRETIIDSKVAVIDYNSCSNCGECYKACQFNAIEWVNKPIVIQELCEGCGVCSYVCPEKAIKMKLVETGDLIVYETKYAPIVTGELRIGRKHSGKLVEMLRERAGKIKNKGLVIIDAAAGTGCPVISSIVGADYLIIVVEPTPQSLRTAGKIADIGNFFNTAMGVVVNKYDLNPSFIQHVKKWANERKIEFLGQVPYDENVVRAYVNAKSLLEYAPNSPATKSLEKILNTWFEKLFEEEA